MKDISIAIIDNDHLLSFEEICRAINSDHQLIIQLIEYQIIQPQGASQKDWVFDHIALKRARLARNFYYDFEVNFEGVALLVDMLEKIEELEMRINQLK